MKKLIITLLIMLFAVTVYGMDIINFDMTVELGIIPGGSFKSYNFTRKVYDNLPLFGDFRLTTNMFNEHLYFGIGSKIIIWKVRENKSFKPDSVNFVFFAGIRVNDYFELKYTHYCDHPLKSWDRNYETNFERSYDKLSILLRFTLFRGDDNE